jgi:hypothetical protein
MLDEYLELLPEEKQSSFKSEIEKLQSRVDLDEYLSKEENLNSLMGKDFFRKKLQSESDRKKAEFEEKFKKESLPELLEAERKKGEKKDWEIRIEQLEAEKAQERKERIREKQINRALAKANETGIPSSLVSKFIGDDDETTDAEISTLVEVLSDWKEKAVQEALKEIGVQNTPKGISKEEPKDLEAQYIKAMQDGNADLALAIQEKMLRQKKRV